MTSAIWPAYFRWDGEAMWPTDRFKARCSDQYTVGETYRLAHEEEASTESRGHYFATLKTMFDTLPDHLASRFPDMDSLRYWSLIRSGYATENMIPCKTEADAIRTIGWLTKQHPHAVFVRHGDTVQIFQARSQSTKSMGKELFQKSKTDVLELVASMIGVNLEEMAKPPAGRPEPPPEVLEAAALEQSPRRPVERSEPKTPTPVPPTPARESSPPQNVGKRPPDPRAPRPKTYPSYRTYLTEWLAWLDDPAAIGLRFNGEGALWAACGMGADEIEACRVMVEQRIGQL